MIKDKNFDVQLEKIEHYQKYSCYMPFIGNNYDKTKFLIIAESHYLPPESQKSKNIDFWYKGVQLNEKEKAWLDTRNCFKDHGERFCKNSAIAKIKKALLEIDIKTNDVAYMNAFQRPCGSKYEKRDIEVAKEVVLAVIKTIEPAFVCFVSKTAFYCLEEDLQKKTQMKIGCSSHPSSPWWNRDKGKIGKEAFKNFAKNVKEQIN